MVIHLPALCALTDQNLFNLLRAGGLACIAHRKHVRKGTGARGNGGTRVPLNGRDPGIQRRAAGVIDVVSKDPTMVIAVGPLEPDIVAGGQDIVTVQELRLGMHTTVAGEVILHDLRTDIPRGRAPHLLAQTPGRELAAPLTGGSILRPIRFA